MSVVGRAASPIRSGIITKRVLMGELPLADGTLVSECAITDIHGGYKMFVERVNQQRDPRHQLKPMNHSSFYTLFKFVRLLGLVDFVREEPMKSPPRPAGSLYMLRNRNKKMSATPSMRRIFKLSEKGLADERSWTDLCTAWREEWLAPAVADHFYTVDELLALGAQRIEKEKAKKEAKPSVAGRSRGRPKQKILQREEIDEEATPPTIFKMGDIDFKMKWSERPTKAQYVKLLDHLVDISEMDYTKNKDIIKHVKSLVSHVEDWSTEIGDREDEANEAGKDDKANELSELKYTLDELAEDLMDNDVEAAVEVIRGLAED